MDSKKEQLSDSITSSKKMVTSFVILYLLIILCFLVTVLYSFTANKKQQITLLQHSLSTLADLKTNSIDQWRKERLEDAATLQDQVGLSQWFQILLSNPSNEETQKNILSRIGHIQSINQYDIFFLTIKGDIIYSFPNNTTEISDYTINVLKQGMLTKKISIVDLHQNEKANILYMGVLQPIFDDNHLSILGFVYLRINPAFYLFPLLDHLSNQPINEATSLLRKEGDYAAYLKETTSLDPTKKLEFIPLTQTKNPGVQAIIGTTGFFNGIDNQGSKVFSEIRAIPDSPWFLVSSIKQQDALRNLYSHLIQILLLFFLIIGIITLDLVHMIQLHRGMLKKELEKSELTKLKIEENLHISEERYQTLFNCVSEFIMVLQNGYIKYYNPRLQEALEYTDQEILTKPFIDFIYAEDQKKVLAIYPPIDQPKTEGDSSQENCSFRLVNTKGIIIWVLVRVIKIEWNHQPATLNLLTDISDQKQIENVLDFHNASLAKLNQFSIELLLLPSLTDLETLIAKRLKEITGAEMALFAIYDSKTKLINTKYLEFKPDLLATANRLFGGSIINTKTLVTDQHYEKMTKEIIGYRKTLYEACFASIPEPIAFSIQKVFHFDRFIGLAFVMENKLYGSSLLAFKKEQLEPPKSILENFIYIVASSLRRKVAEDDLKQFNQELETKIHLRTIDLENSNKALEAFSHSVSHDLRAPLRAINGFSQLLLQKYQGDLGSEPNRLIKIVVDNTNRMDQLITSMLKISTINSTRIKKVKLDMNLLVNSICTENISSSDQKRVTVKLGKLTSSFGDPVLIRQVWVNLIENAVKFSRNKEHPLIQISSYQDKDQTVYQIKDNGAGFNQEYQNKLFIIFQRLHHADEFEGTGVGLALIHRIIQRHGGKVWAEGEEGVGATFSFSLPIQPVESLDSFQSEQKT